MTNDERFVKEVLTYLLEQMDKWNGEIDQMETLLEQCDQKLTALAQSTAGFRANETLARRVIVKYQELLLEMKTQKEEIAKEMSLLNQRATKHNAYAQPVSPDYEFYY